MKAFVILWCCLVSNVASVQENRSMKSSKNGKSSPLLWMIFNQLDRLDTKIIKIQDKTEARQKQITGINTRIGQIQEKTKARQKQITGINIRIGQIQDKAKARQKQITEINTKIHKIHNKTEARQKQITGINTRIDNIQKKNSVLNAKISVLETDVRKLKDNSENGWKFYGNHWYLFRFNKINWHKAKKECERRHSNLVKIDSAAENNWLGSEFLITGTNETIFLIGASDLIKEGKWTWVSDHSTIKYTNWINGEPNDHQGNEDCGAMSTSASFAWNDVPCSEAFGYICEKFSLMDIDIWQ